MIAAFKCYDGQALGADKIEESSGEGDDKVGKIPISPQTTHKNKFEPKPNNLINKLDTTPNPPMFPPQTNNFQKPVRFVNHKGYAIGEKKVRSRMSSPNPSLNQNPSDSIVGIVVEMVTRMSFASRGSMRREWLRSGLIRTSTTLLMVCLSLVCHCPGVR
jgi:hypothetical protein